MTISLGVVILTFNEEMHLDRCLNRAIAISPDIYIIDSFSTDSTLRIASKYGVTVYQRPFVSQSDQLNWFLTHIEHTLPHDFYLRLDADEYILDHSSFHHAINSVDESYNGFCFRLGRIVNSRLLRFGGYQNVSLVRGWRRGCCSVDGAFMDERFSIKGLIFKSKIMIYDHSLITWEDWLHKHIAYAVREASMVRHDQFQIGSKKYAYYLLPPFIRPFLLFIYCFVFRFGFLDGPRQFPYYFLQIIFYRFSVDCILAHRHLSVSGVNLVLPD